MTGGDVHDGGRGHSPSGMIDEVQGIGREHDRHLCRRPFRRGDRCSSSRYCRRGAPVGYGCRECRFTRDARGLFVIDHVVHRRVRDEQVGPDFPHEARDAPLGHFVVRDRQVGKPEARVAGANDRGCGGCLPPPRSARSPHAISCSTPGRRGSWWPYGSRQPARASSASVPAHVISMSSGWAITARTVGIGCGAGGGYFSDANLTGRPFAADRSAA